MNDKEILIDLALESNDLTRSLICFIDHVNAEWYLQDEEAYEWYKRIYKTIHAIRKRWYEYGVDTASILTQPTDKSFIDVDKSLKEILINMALEANDLTRTLICFIESGNLDLNEEESEEWYKILSKSLHSIAKMVRDKCEREKFCNYRTAREKQKHSKLVGIKEAMSELKEF